MKMKRRLSIFVLISICIIYTGCAIEYPQFKSAVSTTGIAANFDTLYLKAVQLKMVYDVVEQDSTHIAWKFKDTGNWGIMKDDGTVAIASTSAFSFAIMSALTSDLQRAKDLVQVAGGVITNAPLINYVDDPYLLRTLSLDFDRDFNLNLFIPECTLHKAILSITGSDYSKIRPYNNALLTPGQHYFIDGTEVSSCDANYCSPFGIKPGRGISCVPGPCNDDPDDELKVSVNPVEITENIAPGLHKISSSSIDNRHTLSIDAITSPSEDKMLLYSDDYRTMINETRSSPMTDLYALILPATAEIDTINAISTTDTTLATNTTT